MSFLKRLFGSGTGSRVLATANPAQKQPAEQLSPHQTVTAEEPGSVYNNRKWGFSIRQPQHWNVAAQEHVEGTWTKPVVLAKTDGGKRVAICIVSIGAMHRGGTISEYIKKAQADLSRSLGAFVPISTEQRTVSGMPTAWMHYSYSDPGMGATEEYNVTYMLGQDTGMGLPLQIVCFTDRQRFPGLKAEFESMIRSLAFPDNRLRLRQVSLYGSSGVTCGSCGASLRPEDAAPVIAFPKNVCIYLCGLCGGCSSKTE